VPLELAGSGTRIPLSHDPQQPRRIGGAEGRARREISQVRCQEARDPLGRLLRVLVDVDRALGLLRARTLRLTALEEAESGGD
jgi:hypothetical protein